LFLKNNFRRRCQFSANSNAVVDEAAKTVCEKWRIIMKNLQAFIIGLLTILFISGAANAATWTVTKFTDSNDNVCDADCSLREAVHQASG
jgi:CSLREA domain-containing protein